MFDPWRHCQAREFTGTVCSPRLGKLTWMQNRCLERDLNSNCWFKSEIVIISQIATSDSVGWVFLPPCLHSLPGWSRWGLYQIGPISLSASLAVIPYADAAVQIEVYSMRCIWSNSGIHWSTVFMVALHADIPQLTDICQKLSAFTRNRQELKKLFRTGKESAGVHRSYQYKPGNNRNL